MFFQVGHVETQFAPAQCSSFGTPAVEVIGGTGPWIPMIFTSMIPSNSGWVIFGLHLPIVNFVG